LARPPDRAAPYHYRDLPATAICQTPGALAPLDPPSKKRLAPQERPQHASHRFAPAQRRVRAPPANRRTLPRPPASPRPAADSRGTIAPPAFSPLRSAGQPRQAAPEKTPFFREGPNRAKTTREFPGRHQPHRASSPGDPGGAGGRRAGRVWRVLGDWRHASLGGRRRMSVPGASSAARAAKLAGKPKRLADARCCACAWRGWIQGGPPHEAMDPRYGTGDGGARARPAQGHSAATGRHVRRLSHSARAHRRIHIPRMHAFRDPPGHRRSHARDESAVPRLPASHRAPIVGDEPGGRETHRARGEAARGKNRRALNRPAVESSALASSPPFKGAPVRSRQPWHCGKSSSPSRP